MKIKFLTLPILFSVLIISVLSACKATNSSAINSDQTKTPSPNPTSIAATDNGEITRPSYNKSTGFFTLDGKIYDANGNEFIARGVNNRHVWYDSWGETPALDALDNIAGFGFNSVRIVWEVDTDLAIIANGKGNLTDDALLEQIIQTTIANKMIPMVELHDFTGRNDPEELLKYGVKWWSDRAHLWEKYEDSLIINIANEFGDWHLAQGSTRKKFPKVYKEAITRIRDAGINNTLVINPFSHAKDYTLVTKYGQEIYNHDPQKNIVFSIHFYCGEGTDQRKIAEAFDSIERKGLPMIVGEFSHSHDPCGSAIEDEFIMAEAEDHKVGYYAWAWDDQEWKIGTHWEADSVDDLTPWGYNLIFGPNGINATSEIASIYDDSLTVKVENVDEDDENDF
ncbi:Cellulase (glycosyl hydrolase family 5) [Xenococcus sp. PCC 7305]|uniref:cellulase family glycosylhydrolase n=1 Tax=Xenococcus sp. PCC 7305 TaxID=102125 RepID=UPI0002ABEFE8|nr:cellulase family glycosylhydrolase [Xenococcus sp. PCC 7305]ELS03881.1 Cellulase (glycosyl hydrolase family 5) [Xenococcus sp. PCC 7305]